MKERAIYSITNTVTGKKYIGQSSQPQMRQRQHMKSWSRCLALNAAVKSYGPAAFKFRILGVGFDRAMADIVERALIRDLHTRAPGGYNLTDGGEGGLCTAEGRLKISLSKKGIAPMAAIRAASEARRGKPLKPETIRKISEYRRRWHQDPANKRRHSEAVKAGMSRHRIKEVHPTP